MKQSIPFNNSLPTNALIESLKCISLAWKLILTMYTPIYTPFFVKIHAKSLLIFYTFVYKFCKFLCLIIKLYDLYFRLKIQIVFNNVQSMRILLCVSILNIPIPITIITITILSLIILTPTYQLLYYSHHPAPIKPSFITQYHS